MCGSAIRSALPRRRLSSSTASPSSAIPAATACRRSSMRRMPAARSCADGRRSVCRGDRSLRRRRPGWTGRRAKAGGGNERKDLVHDDTKSRKTDCSELDARQSVGGGSFAAIDVNLFMLAVAAVIMRARLRMGLCRGLFAAPIFQDVGKLEVFRDVGRAIDKSHAGKKQEGTAHKFVPMLQKQRRQGKFGQSGKQRKRDGENDIPAQSRPNIEAQRGTTGYGCLFGRLGEFLKIEIIIGPQLFGNRGNPPLHQVERIFSGEIERFELLAA